MPHRRCLRRMNARTRFCDLVGWWFYLYRPSHCVCFLLFSVSSHIYSVALIFRVGQFLFSLSLPYFLPSSSPFSSFLPPSRPFFIPSPFPFPIIQSSIVYLRTQRILYTQLIGTYTLLVFPQPHLLILIILSSSLVVLIYALITRCLLYYLSLLIVACCDTCCDTH